MLDTFVGLIDGYKIWTIAILIIADFAAGVLVAIKEKTFSWSKLPSFLKTDFLFMAGGYLVVGTIATVESTFTFLVPATFAALSVGLLAQIVSKLKKLGVPAENS